MLGFPVLWSAKDEATLKAWGENFVEVNYSMQSVWGKTGQNPIHDMQLYREHLHCTP